MKKLTLRFALFCGMTLAFSPLFAQQNFSVTVQSNSFTPKNIAITVGDTVTWTNIQGTHNVNGTQTTFPANPASFGNGSAASSPWTYSFVFDSPGSYNYQCDPHASLGMTGTVTVEPASTPSSSLVLTGIFDGPLPGGTPKGVELFVREDIADLSEYGLGSANNGGGSSGVEFTFPAVSATAGTYLYVSIEGPNFEAYFGFPPDFVDDGNPSSVAINGDDAVELFRNGTVVDVFGDINVDGTGQPWEYLDGWAYRVNGTGPDGSTFVLSNWFFSGIDAFDNTTSNDEAALPMPIGTYDPGAAPGITANNDQATTASGQSVIIDVLSNDFTPNPLTGFGITSFPANGTASVMPQQIIIYNPNPGFCGTDSFTYEICDAENCSTATVTVTVTCPLPLYSIGQVTSVNADGVADSLNLRCELRGIVYGVNLRPLGLQFTLIDNDNDGIGVFNNNRNFGYTVQEGDEIAVQGRIDQFNGLTQIVVDTVWLLSTGNSLQAPTIVTALDEATESQLVKIENLTLVNPSQWSPSGAGFNVDVTDGSRVFQMRINVNVDLFNEPAPNGPFNLTGIGSQFDNSLPYTEGYQILPRYQEDIALLSSTISPSLGERIRFFPNPARDVLYVQSQEQLDLIRISTINGQKAAEWRKPEMAATLELAKLPGGTYLITFVKGNQIWAAELIKL